MATSKTMRADATEKEFLAIEKEIISLARDGKPYNQLTCPRCGGTMTLEEFGASYSVRCETDGCIEYAVRGI